MVTVFFEPVVQEVMLYTGQVDAITDMYFASVATFGCSEEYGEGTDVVNCLFYSDYGLDIYAYGIVARSEFIDKNPDVVRGFMRATFKAYNDMLVNPQEAINVYLKYYPEQKLAKATELKKIYGVWEMILTDEIYEHGYGWMDEERVRQTCDIMCEAFDIEEEISLGNIYNEFLPKYFLPKNHHKPWN